MNLINNKNCKWCVTEEAQEVFAVIHDDRKDFCSKECFDKAQEHLAEMQRYGQQTKTRHDTYPNCGGDE